MTEIKFCNTCQFWEDNIINTGIGKFGICHNIEVSTKIIVDDSTQLEEDNTFYTENFFGCIYWRPGKFELINFENIISL